MSSTKYSGSVASCESLDFPKLKLAIHCKDFSGYICQCQNRMGVAVKIE